jgi:hypothetical protein
MSEEVETLAEAPTQQAVTVGGTIVATTTIDAILTSILPTRSADLAATPVYTWASAVAPWELHATWAAASGPAQLVAIRFEVRNVAPSSVGP